VIDEAEGLIVKRVFTLYDEGMGLGRMAKRLTAEGVRAPRGGHTWTAGPLRLMLRRPVYVGRRAFARTMTTVAASIKGRLRDELSRRDALAAELARLETVTPVDTDALALAASARAADLRGLLRRHPAQARQVLRLVVGEGRFTCTPFDDASGRGFDVRAEGDYSRLFTIRDFHTRLVRLRAIALTRSPA
jgi:hypothetical protein